MTTVAFGGLYSTACIFVKCGDSLEYEGAAARSGHTDK